MMADLTNFINGEGNFNKVFDGCIATFHDGYEVPCRWITQRQIVHIASIYNPDFDQEYTVLNLG